jgi:hypothetical protein
MNALPLKALIAILSLGAMLPAFVPAARAQQGPDAGTEKVQQIIVYGDDPCPASSGDAITVCARLPDKDRYRIPAALRTDPNDPKVQSWLNRAQSIEYVGRSGTDSCSPVGAGGFTGCFQQMARNAKAERKAMMGDASWADLVAAEREKRLSVIDADSAKIEAHAKAEEAADAAKAQGGNPPSQ